MSDATAIRRRLELYAGDADPLTRGSNRLALLLAANQPFYPLYVWRLTGALDPLLALTFVSMPFFLAAPWVTKRYPAVGRLYFPAVGALNTFFCAFVFGSASGVELFLAPCVAIAALSCRATERTALGAFLAGLLVAFVFLHDCCGSPLYRAGREQYQALLTLNAYSAALLTAMAVWMLSAARAGGGVKPPKT